MSIRTGITTSEKITYPISLGTDTTLFGLDGYVLFVQGDFLYQQKIKDWLAVYLNLGFAVRTGNELSSITLEGINTLTKFELGWKFKLIRTSRFMLSGGFSITNNEAVFINISEALRIFNTNNANKSFTEEVPALYSSVKTSLAWGLTPTIGVTGSLNVGFGESLVRGEAAAIYDGQMGIEADLYARTKVPLGLRFTFRSSTVPELLWANSGTTEVYSLRIAYTQSKDFRLAIDSNLSRSPIEDISGDASLYGFNVNLQYYFN
jgi:hypothetical protein